jgi:hypothetical protein
MKRKLKTEIYKTPNINRETINREIINREIINRKIIKHRSPKIILLIKCGQVILAWNQ